MKAKVQIVPFAARGKHIYYVFFWQHAISLTAIKKLPKRKQPTIPSSALWPFMIKYVQLSKKVAKDVNMTARIVMTWMFQVLHTRLCLDKQDLVQWMKYRKINIKDKKKDRRCHQKINVHYKGNIVFFADLPTADHSERC